LANEENLNLEYRLKPVGIAGGIMSTLRTATNVAPGALPSLTLIRRQDLLAAERAGYLQSLEGQVSSAIQGDLETALALGQVDNVLYGVPYLLELQHLVYRPESNTDYSDWTYQAILDRKLPFLFAGGRVGGLSDVFYLQYLSDGGTLDSEGLLTLDESALLKTLSFYQAASDMGLVDGFNMNYSSSRDYMNAFIAGEYNIGIFDSGTFLRLHQDETGLQIASIPTSNGEATSILNGWIWVMIARDEDEQAAASRYLNWMMDTERQAEFARAIYQVPSRQSALALGLVSDAPIEPYLAMLENPVLPVSDGEVGSLGRLIQEALSSVVTLELSADEALDYVVQELTE
jgi:ABC-type glycerol-3-phosphate transport system substrate-binding protein